MAIQNVAADETYIEISKKVDESSEALVSTVLQKAIYAQPVDSIVREYVSNARDAIREAIIFREIINNPEKEKEYYQVSENIQYKHSKFDPNYTSLEWLSEEKNVFVEVSGNTFSVTDYGIGVTFERLIGMTNLGFSTKRLSKEFKGFYGLGAKSAIAYARYYTLDCICNGKRFVFDCYEKDVKPQINKFNAEGSLNPFVTYQGKKIYYEETLEKNRTKFILKIETRDALKFSESVQKQLLYFNNVILKAEGKIINFRQSVIFENEHFIINSSKSPYSGVQVVVVNELKEKNTDAVCYGKLNFSSLDINWLNGNLAIKVQIRSEIKTDDGVKVLNEGVEVTPSRESIIYNYVTKEYLLKRIKECRASIEEIINNSRPEFLMSDSIFQRLEKIKNYSHSEDKIQMASFAEISLDSFSLGNGYTLSVGNSVVYKEDDDNNRYLKAYKLASRPSYSRKKNNTLKYALKDHSLTDLPDTVYLKDRSFNNEFNEHLVNTHQNIVILEVYKDNVLKDIPVKVVNYSDFLKESSKEKEFEEAVKKKRVSGTFNYEWIVHHSPVEVKKAEFSDKIDLYYCLKDEFDIDQIKNMTKYLGVPIARIPSNKHAGKFEGSVKELMIKNIDKIMQYRLEDEEGLIARNLRYNRQYLKLFPELNTDIEYLNNNITGYRQGHWITDFYKTSNFEFLKEEMDNHPVYKECSRIFNKLSSIIESKPDDDSLELIREQAIIGKLRHNSTLTNIISESLNTYFKTY